MSVFPVVNCVASTYMRIYQLIIVSRSSLSCWCNNIEINYDCMQNKYVYAGKTKIQMKFVIVYTKNDSLNPIKLWSAQTGHWSM